MKNIFLALLFTGAFYKATAQYIAVNDTSYKRITKDTINIRGVVQDYFGKPVRSIQVISTNKELVFWGYPIYTYTDTAGRFVLNGALPRDTLTISYTFRPVMKVVNNGSRYLEITLPAQNKVKKRDTVEISAPRQKKKKYATFKVLTSASISDYFGLPEGDFEPRFIGAPNAFHDFVSSAISYPQKAIENNIEGEVEIGFDIDRAGILKNPHVIKGIGYGCDDVVIQAVKKSPKWVPGIQQGRTIAGTSSVVVEFKLTDK